MSPLCVFTAGNDLALLRASCERVGITLHEFDGTWTTFLDIKVRRARKFLEGRTEEFAMWMDGHDSLVLKPERVILARALCNFATPVVVAAESNCFPDADAAERYPLIDEKLPRFLNAGGWIGARLALIETLKYIEDTARTDDDQREWTRAYLERGLPIGLDHRRHVFACVGDGVGAMDADPCTAHWNGRIGGRQEYWEALCTI